MEREGPQNSLQEAEEILRAAQERAAKEAVNFFTGYMEHEAETREQEVVVLVALAGRVSGLERLTQQVKDNGESLQHILTRLRVVLDDDILSPPLQSAAWEMVEILSAVLEVASSMGEFAIAKKRAVQASLLERDLLPQGIKTALLQIADEVTGGDGINLSDPDDVMEALQESRAAEDRLRSLGDRSRLKRQLFDARVAPKFGISPFDPEYRYLRDTFSLLVNNPENIDRFVRLSEETLEVLGIDPQQLIAELRGILEALQEDS